MRYFKHRWEDLRGDQYDDWGFCWDYWEVDESGNFARSLNIYDGGQALRYDVVHTADQYGQLPSGPVPFDSLAPEHHGTLQEIEREEFQNAWDQIKSLNAAG